MFPSIRLSVLVAIFFATSPAWAAGVVTTSRFATQDGIPTLTVTHDATGTAQTSPAPAAPRMQPVLTAPVLADSSPAALDAMTPAAGGPDTTAPQPKVRAVQEFVTLHPDNAYNRAVRLLDAPGAVSSPDDTPR